MSNSAKFEGGGGVFNMLPESQGQQPNISTLQAQVLRKRGGHTSPANWLTQGVSSQLFHVTSQQKIIMVLFPLHELNNLGPRFSMFVIHVKNMGVG